jgi:hypothetical protein
MRSISNAVFSSCVLVGAALAACDTSSDGGLRPTRPSSASGCTPTIASIQEKLLLPRCATAGCHTASAPAGNLDLASAGVEARLVGVESVCPSKVLVAPGDPDDSYFVEKLTNATPACGGRMPSASAMDPGDIACITDWISALPPGSGGDGGTPLSCGLDETSCGDACRKTKTDPTNCGSCGNVCGASEKFCVNGTCSATCPNTDCSGVCVDTATNADHCGTCGNKCTGGKVCVASACSCGTAVATLSGIQASIFTPACTGGGCHSQVGMRGPAEGLELASAAASHRDLVGKPSASCSGRTRVVPGDVASSYLMNKLTGVGMCSGSKMPKGPGLSAAQIDQVRSWICNGAANN